jgi:hypothetical protein
MDREWLARWHQADGNKQNQGLVGADADVPDDSSENAQSALDVVWSGTRSQHRSRKLKAARIDVLDLVLETSW